MPEKNILRVPEKIAMQTYKIVCPTHPTHYLLIRDFEHFMSLDGRIPFFSCNKYFFHFWLLLCLLRLLPEKVTVCPKKMARTCEMKLK